jgi:DNA polymerase-3 subunit epsilon
VHLQLQLPGLLGDEDPLAQELRNITFVIVDLETTGGAPDGGGITEVGAVKVRGGEQLGQLATLVNPGVPIPPFITVLTGITTTMVLPAPPIERVLPSLLEFLSGAVLVAHNAPYDVGFLKAACAAHGYRWPTPRVLDTALMARRVLLRDEVPNRKLGTLAAYFHTHGAACADAAAGHFQAKAGCSKCATRVLRPRMHSSRNWYRIAAVGAAIQLLPTGMRSTGCSPSPS